MQLGMWTRSPVPSPATANSKLRGRWRGIGRLRTERCGDSRSVPRSLRCYDITTCKHAASRVDEISRPFAGDRELELAAVPRAWSYFADHMDNDILLCEKAARHVDEIARPFAGERDFEL